MMYDRSKEKLECEVKNFSYGAIENAISAFYGLGIAHSSDFVELKNNEIRTVYISFSKADGYFNIMTYTADKNKKMISCTIKKLIKKK